MSLVVDPRVAWQVLDGEAVLIDLERSVALGLNPSASFLWTRLAGRTPEQLATDLASAFGLAPAQARCDVDEFLDLLRVRGYVSG